MASRLCDEAKPEQILIGADEGREGRHEPVGEFELKGIRRPLAPYNVVASVTTHSDSSDSAD